MNTGKNLKERRLAMDPKIFEYSGKRVVSARELYEGLGMDITHYNRWVQKNILKSQFAIENEDFSLLAIKANVDNQIVKNPKPTKDYALSIDFAKRLAMMARTEAGERVRQYFIKCEQMVQKRMLSPAEQLLANAQLLVDMEHRQQMAEERQKTLEQKVEEIDIRTTTRTDYFTIMGYARLRGLHIGLKQAASIGAKAKRMCKENGYPVETIPDPRFGVVGSYPKSVLEQVF